MHTTNRPTPTKLMLITLLAIGLAVTVAVTLVAITKPSHEVPDSLRPQAHVYEGETDRLFIRIIGLEKVVAEQQKQIEKLEEKIGE